MRISNAFQPVLSIHEKKENNLVNKQGKKENIFDLQHFVTCAHTVHTELKIKQSDGRIALSILVQASSILNPFPSIK